MKSWEGQHEKAIVLSSSLVFAGLFYGYNMCPLCLCLKHTFIFSGRKNKGHISWSAKNLADSEKRIEEDEEDNKREKNSA